MPNSTLTRHSSFCFDVRQLLIGRYDFDASGELDLDEWTALVLDAYKSSEGGLDFGGAWLLAFVIRLCYVRQSCEAFGIRAF